MPSSWAAHLLLPSQCQRFTGLMFPPLVSKTPPVSTNRVVKGIELFSDDLQPSVVVVEICLIIPVNAFRRVELRTIFYGFPREVKNAHWNRPIPHVRSIGATEELSSPAASYGYPQPENEPPNFRRQQ